MGTMLNQLLAGELAHKRANPFGDAENARMTVERNQLSDLLNVRKQKMLELQQANEVARQQYIDPYDIGYKQAQTQKLLSEIGAPTKPSWKVIESGGKQYRVDENSGKVEPLMADGIQMAGKKVKPESIVGGTDANIQTARDVMGMTKEAKKDVGWWSTGLIGQVLSGVGGTEALALKKKIDPIIANLGFDRLQQMRDQSETGGALGSIAVKELDMLQSTVASLDQAQSEEALNAALDKVYKHYDNWVKAMEAAKSTGETGNISPSRSGATVPVRSEQEALSLPSGTRFKLPDGRTGTAR